MYINFPFQKVDAVLNAAPAQSGSIFQRVYVKPLAIVFHRNSQYLFLNRMMQLYQYTLCLGMFYDIVDQFLYNQVNGNTGSLINRYMAIDFYLLQFLAVPVMAEEK